MSRPRCGNDPRAQLTDGDRQAVEGFKAYLAERAALRDRIAEALEQADYRPDMRRGDLADAIMPVLPAPTDRASVLRGAASHLARQADELWAPGTTAHTVMHADATELRRLADEAQPAQPQVDEDPARIDRMRPEFTEHASVEAIDAQIRRAQAQERRWHIRAEWLISLRTTRAAQKELGAQP
jgi:hypothetical protein